MDAVDIKANRIGGYDISVRGDPFAGTIHPRILSSPGLAPPAAGEKSLMDLKPEKLGRRLFSTQLLSPRAATRGG